MQKDLKTNSKCLHEFAWKVKQRGSSVIVTMVSYGDNL